MILPIFLPYRDRKPGQVISSFLVSCLLFSHAATAATLTVAVASNFAETLELLATEFEIQSTHELILVRGSSGRHFSQIINGAPYDVFFSADSDRPLRLQQRLELPPDRLYSYAHGKLVLWGAQDGSAIDAQRKLETDSFKTLAIANPRLAPYGRAAVESLQAMGIWTILDSERGRLVRGENIAQAYQFVATGNAEIGFVALSQVLSAGDDGYWVVPQALYRPIVQQLLILRDTAETRDLVQFLASDRARSIIRQSGYDLP